MSMISKGKLHVKPGDRIPNVGDYIQIERHPYDHSEVQICKAKIEDIESIAGDVTKDLILYVKLRVLEGEY